MLSALIDKFRPLPNSFVIVAIVDRERSRRQFWEGTVIVSTLDRRRMMEGLGALIGLAALPPEALAATKRKSRPSTALLTAVADTLIPRTDTPGAVQVGVPAKFDALMHDWASPAHRAEHLAALAAIDDAAKTKAGRPFALLALAARKSMLAAYDAENFATNATYARLKALLVSLYYMTEPGATKELRYEHAPGAWVASIPLTPQTRAWAGANVG
jgi:gluconate 2-dehydrogenase gamma chain